MIGLVAQEYFAVLEADAGDSQPMSVRVLQVVDADGSKSVRARLPQFTFVPLSA